MPWARRVVYSRPAAELGAAARQVVALDVVRTALHREVERCDRRGILPEAGEQLATHGGEPVAAGQLRVQPVERVEAGARAVALGERHGRREPHGR